MEREREREREKLSEIVIAGAHLPGQIVNKLHVIWTSFLSAKQEDT